MQTQYGVILLCGGMSQRMGSPKWKLPFGHQTILDRTLATLEKFSSQIVLSAAPQQIIDHVPYTVINDRIEGQGPLTGLYDVVAQMPEILEWNAALICSCDMPFLTHSVLNALLENFEKNDSATIAIFEEADRWHPFPGLYAQEALTEINQLVRSGKRKMLDLLNTVGSVQIPVENYPELVDQNALMNVNTQEEYQRALKLAGLKN